MLHLRPPSHLAITPSRDLLNTRYRNGIPSDDHKNQGRELSDGELSSFNVLHGRITPSASDETLVDGPATAQTEKHPIRTYTSSSDGSLGLISSTRTRYLLRAAPFFLGSLIWFSMIAYFLLCYLTRAHVDGKQPRIGGGGSYALWPYISSIGATKEVAFTTLPVFVAGFVITGFVMDGIAGRNVQPGIYFRYSKMAFGTVSCCFLVAVSRTPIELYPTRHVVLTSVHVWTLSLAKSSDYWLSYRMGRRCREPHLALVRKCRKTIGFVALPTGFLFLIGSYRCIGSKETPFEGTQCYTLVSISAIAEWILALCYVLYLMVLSYDQYWIEVSREVVIATAKDTKHLHPHLKFLNGRLRRREDFTALLDRVERLEKKMEMLSWCTP
ncbi:hypothetical protein NA57DRAFT_54629 [Rhizodiscina lignyota]|uniref:CWH43-like N-terminal domain-containing protein n=1 Tax=Rhizodiscina lignyota TaxID=1504668 RepID=A0A9P4IF11_9PEZI|nr:hypothetical protein NA57DRAFT_54629 [Rhizodiscina lignyota]